MYYVIIQFIVKCDVRTNDILHFNRKMPDVETIMEPWMDGGDQKDRKVPDFKSADLLTLIDEVCGTCLDIIF